MKKWYERRRQTLQFPLWTLLLVNIHTRGGQTTSTLAKVMKTHYSSINAYLHQFEKLGLIMRVRQGREVKCYTTTNGAAAAKMLYSTMVLTKRGGD